MVTENNGTIEKPGSRSEAPILQLSRLNYVKVSGKILDTTNEKLKHYIEFASGYMKTEITDGDIIEHALKLLFERDAGFKNWLRQNIKSGEDQARKADGNADGKTVGKESRTTFSALSDPR